MFVACHPVLSVPSRIALTLRLLGGLTHRRDRRAFLQPEATIAQRIVRAKKTIADARGALRGARRCGPRRATAVGARGRLPDLQRGLLGDLRRATGCGPICAPRRSGSVACSPRSSRRSRGARAPGADGAPVVAARRLASAATASRCCCSTRTVGRWDRLLINRGLASLDRAGQLTDAPGPYALQAAIAACHARASRAGGDRLGARSCACTTCWRWRCRHRSSSSTAPWRCRWPRDRRRRW